VVYKLAANIRAKIGPLLAFSHLSAESADYIDIALFFYRQDRLAFAVQLLNNRQSAKWLPFKAKREVLRGSFDHEYV
jgi:hypothetical protein